VAQQDSVPNRGYAHIMRAELKELSVGVAFLAVGVAFGFAPRFTSGVISAALFAIAGAMLVEDQLRARKGLRASGHVVDHKRVEDAYFPVIEFTDSDWETRRLATITGTGRKRPRVGTHVVVVYDVTGDHGCEIDTVNRRWGPVMAVAVLGGAFALGAVLSR